MTKNTGKTYPLVNVLTRSILASLLSAQALAGTMGNLAAAPCYVMAGGALGYMAGHAFCPAMIPGAVPANPVERCAHWFLAVEEGDLRGKSWQEFEKSSER